MIVRRQHREYQRERTRQSNFQRGALVSVTRRKATRSRRRSPRDSGPPKIVALLAACPLYPAPEDGACGACGKSLTGRRTRWCSRSCARSWRENHVWTAARRAARSRDKRTCRSCGVKGAAKPSRRRFASDAAYDVALAAYKAVKLEVNHVAGLVGIDRSKAGCGHHLSGLETLCSACHAPITAAQAAERAAIRRAAKAAALAALPIAEAA